MEKKSVKLNDLSVGLQLVVRFAIGWFVWKVIVLIATIIVLLNK